MAAYLPLALPGQRLTALRWLLCLGASPLVPWFAPVTQMGVFHPSHMASCLQCESQICHLPSSIPCPSPEPLPACRGAGLAEQQTLKSDLNSASSFVTFSKLFSLSVPEFRICKMETIIVGPSES